MRYFFVVEPIKGMEGDLLGVEVITQFVSPHARPLHPEFVFSSWDSLQKRRFLLDQLRSIADQRHWFEHHGLFCLFNIDRDMAQLVLQDNDIRTLLHGMLFVGLEITERFSLEDNVSVDPLLVALYEQPNPLWLEDLGAGNATVAPLVCGCFSGVKLDRGFFASQIDKPTFPLLIRQIRGYCDNVVVGG